MLKQVFDGQQAAGKQLQGGPVRCYKDDLKETLKKCGLQLKSVCMKPLDWDSWHVQCQEAVAQFETNHVAVLESKYISCRQSAEPGKDADD